MSAYWILRREDGSVDTLVFGLPQTWRNVDGLPGLSDEALLDLGWERLADAELDEDDEETLLPLVFTSVVARIREKRWMVETGGMVVGGMPVATDERSARLIQGMYTAAKDEVAETFEFQGPGLDNWIDVPAAQAILVGRALFALVQGCFSAGRVHENAATALRDAGDPKALGAYDFTSGWPS